TDDPRRLRTTPPERTAPAVLLDPGDRGQLAAVAARAVAGGLRPRRGDPAAWRGPQARAPAGLLWGDAGSQGHRARLPRKPGHRDHRAFGLRQVDDDSMHQPDARGDPGRESRG